MSNLLCLSPQVGESGFCRNHIHTRLKSYDGTFIKLYPCNIQ